MLPVLEIKDLSISFLQDGKSFIATEGITLNIQPGEFTAIVGESGSGKSVTALSVLRLLPSQAKITGSILFNDKGLETELTNIPVKQLQQIRGNRIAMIFQEPMTSLNPVYTCGYQVMESLKKHRKLSDKSAREKVIELFTQVELPDPASILNRYPHQLSGGQKQRVMIAMAMSCEPAVLIADEPTTALDVLVQANILNLLKSLQQRTGMAVILITHDLSLVADVADKVAVMYKGKIAEQGITKDILYNPQHSYTKALLACRPAAAVKGHKLAVVNEQISEKNGSSDLGEQNISDEITLSVDQLKVHFPSKKDFLGRTIQWIRAVDDVSFKVRKNEILGLVGESGCGKTTLGRTILQLIKPTSGKIILKGRDITTLSPSELRHARKDFQIVFQDPYGSLNPRITVGNAILEPLKVHGLYENVRNRKERVIQLLEKVNLSADHYNRYPHQFSGGQRQRICIARALAIDPSFLIFDESVSALDVSVQAQVLNLINELRASMDLTAVFISHDLAVVHYICDRIMVMKNGKIIEEGPASQVFYSPEESYTKKLIAAIPGKLLNA